MHYKDGTPAKLWDVVKFKKYSPNHDRTGVLVHLSAQSTSCNGQVQYNGVQHCVEYDQETKTYKIVNSYSTLQNETVTIGECELLARQEMDEKGNWTYLPAAPQQQ